MMRPGYPSRRGLVLCCALLANCAQNPVTGNPNFVMMSEQEEVRVGQQEDANVRKQYGECKCPELQAYVNEVGQRLAKASHRPQLNYKFTVVDSPEINAFALPGGYIYVTRGILAYMNSEAELAGVLGHEIGHVTARHSVQQLSAANAASIGATIASILVPGLRNDAAQSLVGLLGNALLSGYGREHELEADRLGAEYLARTGYEPQAMIAVVGVLKNQEVFDAEIAKQEGREPRRYHGVFASHPDNDTRLQQVVKEADKFRQSGHIENRDGFLRRLDRTVYGDSPEQGIVRQGTFNHPSLGLALRFPGGWKIQNQPDKVVAISPTQDALLELRAAGPAKGSPAEVLRRAVRLGSGAEVTPREVNGLPAATAATSVQGLPARVTAIFHGSAAYLVGGSAKTSQALNRYQGDIDAAVQSFRALGDAERRSVRPLTIRIANAGPATTYAELAKVSPLGRNAEGYLRLINAHYPTGEPAPGQAIKIVE